MFYNKQTNTCVRVYLHIFSLMQFIYNNINDGNKQVFA